MQLPDQQLDTFIALYEKHFGVVLDRETALKKGIELCNFVRIVSFSSPVEVDELQEV